VNYVSRYHIVKRDSHRRGYQMMYNAVTRLK
jgi:hypothetical protein